MLLREDGRRHQHQDLLAVDRDCECRAQRDLGLAEADVAADQAVHRVRRLEILLHRFDRCALVLRLAVWKLVLELLDPLVLHVVRDPGLGLALCVELQQFPGHLAQMSARARLQVVPCLAAELRESRRLRIGADVTADLADLLVRNVDPVVSAIGEQEVVARDACDLLRLEAEQLRDAVVLVHHVVARAQVGEALKRAAGRARRARRPLPEHLCVREQCETELTPYEPASRGRHRELELARLLARFEQPRPNAPQE